MSALKSLPEVETVGWYVRTRITDEDRDGSIVSNSGASLADHYAYAHTYGNTIAALTCEAINVARETGIGPAEMRRQRDELLEALKEQVTEYDTRMAEYRACGNERIAQIAEQHHGARIARARAAIANAEGKS